MTSSRWDAARARRKGGNQATPKAPERGERRVIIECGACGDTARVKLAERGAWLEAHNRRKHTQGVLFD